MRTWQCPRQLQFDQNSFVLYLQLKLQTVLVLLTFKVRYIIAKSRKGCAFSHQNAKDEVAVGPTKEDVAVSMSASI